MRRAAAATFDGRSSSLSRAGRSVTLLRGRLPCQVTARHAAFSTIQAQRSVEAHADMRCLLGQQRRGCQARLRVHFEQHEAARALHGVVVAKIRTRRAAATERAMRGERDIHRGA